MFPSCQTELAQALGGRAELQRAAEAIKPARVGGGHLQKGEFWEPDDGVGRVKDSELGGLEVVTVA